MQTQKRDAVISARIPAQLKRLVIQFIRIDTYLNESDLLRDALREKILRDAPELYRQLFQKEAEK